VFFFLLRIVRIHNISNLILFSSTAVKTNERKFYVFFVNHSVRFKK